MIKDAASYSFIKKLNSEKSLPERVEVFKQVGKTKNATVLIVCLLKKNYDFKVLELDELIDVRWDSKNKFLTNSNRRYLGTKAKQIL